MMKNFIQKCDVKSTLVCLGHLRAAVVPSSARREKSWRELAMVARGSVRLTLYWQSRGGEGRAVRVITMEICLGKIFIFLSVDTAITLSARQIWQDWTGLAATEGIVKVRGEAPHLSAAASITGSPLTMIFHIDNVVLSHSIIYPGISVDQKLPNLKKNTFSISIFVALICLKNSGKALTRHKNSGKPCKLWTLKINIQSDIFKEPRTLQAYKPDSLSVEH